MAMVLNSPSPTVGLSKFSTFRVMQANHDGLIKSSSTGIDTGYELLCANHTSDTLHDWNSFALLTAENIGEIPKSTTIKAALLYLAAGGNRGNSPASKMSFELTDNPALPSSKTDLQNKTRGSILTFAPAAGTYSSGNKFSVDMTSRVQTMVNRTGWACNKLMWLWDQGADYDGTNTFLSVKAYDTDPDLAPYLVIEW